MKRLDGEFILAEGFVIMLQGFSKWGSSNHTIGAGPLLAYLLDDILTNNV